MIRSVPTESTPMQIAAVAPDDWPLVEQLLGSGRSSGSCWCQWFRLAPADYDHMGVADRRARLGEGLATGASHALLASRAGAPIGWLSLGPIQEFRPRLERWSVAPPSFEPGTWAINCLFIREADRRGRVGAGLIRAAVNTARVVGATELVAFPLLAPATGRPEGATGVGYVEQFLEAGFEVRPGAIESRPLAVHHLARIPTVGP